jgi:antitoxin PrlF
MTVDTGLRPQLGGNVKLPYFGHGGSAMTTYTVTTKGQITLRKELLQHLGVRAQEKISIDKLPGGEIRIRASRATGMISELFGMLKRDRDRAVSIDDMNDAIARGWAGQR